MCPNHESGDSFLLSSIDDSIETNALCIQIANEDGQKCFFASIIYIFTILARELS